MSKLNKYWPPKGFFPITAFVLLAFIVVGVVASASWVVVDEAIHATSGPDFCTSCHSMEPFGLAFEKSKHGGNNEYGVEASCSDCHIPHDNALHYLVIKGRNGIRDVWVETFTDTDKHDWEGRRADREEFVYDSGCLQCHVDIGEKYVEEHARYLAGQIQSTCVSCHEHVGHTEMSQFLLKSRYE